MNVVFFFVVNVNILSSFMQQYLPEEEEMKNGKKVFRSSKKEKGKTFSVFHVNLWIETHKWKNI